jgi:hypothetical protein
LSELREVSLERIHPNPFRDIENYPFWRDKLDRLKESIKSTFAWPNIIVRQRRDGQYELAFGHHRIQALRELAEEGHIKPVVKVILEPLDDNQMLKMMADENAEEFGTNFSLGTMNAVSAVVRAFAAGSITLGKVSEFSRKSILRQAPSFIQGNAEGNFTYTADTVAQYLGWVKQGDQDAQVRVVTALAALELIELGVCKPQAFQGLSHEQSRAVVSQAQLVYKSRMRELDKKAEEREVKAAQQEAKKLAAKAVSHAVGALKDGAGIRELRDETSAIREKLQPAPSQPKLDPKGVDISRMLERAAGELEDYTAKLEILEERHTHSMLKLYAAGAICDERISKKYAKAVFALAKAANNFDNSFAKCEERRG